jgi:murein DD-endopeptidase MepM/ murein hydrolase activator NlpD
MRRTFILICVVGLSGCSPLRAAAQGPTASTGVRQQALEPAPAVAAMAPLRQLAATMLTADAGGLWRRLSAEMQRIFGDQQRLQTFGAGNAVALGPETGLHGERLYPYAGAWVYSRQATFTKSKTVMETVVATLGDGQIVLASVKEAKPFPPAAASAHLDYQTKTVLRLPFEGEWYVFWGGRTVAQNYHAEHADQRFAYDLEVVRNGNKHQGDGKQNTDYFCYGRPILVPGDGLVATVVDQYPDNVPGKTNPADHPAGNHVCIDHGNGEYSMLCHLQPGSIAVKPGQQVKAGQKVGLTGNSGNTSEPHLHYHLQTTATFFQGQGLPPQFRNYRADGQPVDRGEPFQGQFVRP